MSQPHPQTPCVGICSTVFGDEVCRGCKRFLHEIIEWNGYSPQQKQQVMTRLERQIIQIMEPRIDILDSARLERQLRKYQVRYRPEQHPLCWAYDLLRVGAERIQQLARYGLAIKPPYADYSLPQLRNDAETHLYTLALEFYQRQPSPSL